MTTKNGVEFRQIMLSKSKYRIKAPYAMTPKKITYHNTDNMMPAINEIKYMIENNLQVSYHIAVDEKEAIQAVPYDRNTWNAGDGGNGYGNRNTISLEICRNYDRNRRTTNLISPLKEQYAQAEINAVMYGAVVMYENGIAPVLGNVKFHNDWSGKNCPSKILNERRGSAFKALAVAEAVKYKAKMEGKPVPETPTTPQPAPATTKPAGSVALTTNSVVDYLNATGRDDSFANRARLASQYGISGYKGTASQNTELLDKLRAGLPSAPAPSPVPKPTQKGDMKTTSVVDYLASIGEDNGFNRRKQLAEANGIRNYKGTASQNTKLLDKLRGGTAKASKPAGKSIDQMAQEVIDGKHGNGHDNRRKSLGVSQSVYNKVRDRVNKIATGKSAPKKAGMSIEQMANKIINDPKAPQGHENRRKWLGVDQATYNKVRNLVNRKL